MQASKEAVSPVSESSIWGGQRWRELGSRTWWEMGQIQTGQQVSKGSSFYPRQAVAAFPESLLLHPHFLNVDFLQDPVP